MSYMNQDGDTNVATPEPRITMNNSSCGNNVNDKLKPIITPVSLAQIERFTQPNSDLYLHGKKVQFVGVYAFIRKILYYNPELIRILVDDYLGGGPLEVTYAAGFVHDLDDSMFNETSMPEGEEKNPKGAKEGISSLKVGDKIRCIGVPTFETFKPSLLAYTIRISNDTDIEILMHYMRIMQNSILYERLFHPKANDDNNNKIDDNTTNPPMDVYGISKACGHKNLSNREKHIFGVLRKGTAGKSVNLDETVQIFENYYTESQIENSLLALADEGFCWQEEDKWSFDCEDCFCVRDVGAGPY